MEISEKQNALLETLPPDQRASIMSKMRRAGELQSDVEEAFEEVESTEATLVEPEADELQDTRASIADWISSNVLNK